MAPGLPAWQKSLHGDRATTLRQISLGMVRGGNGFWWQHSLEQAPQDEMTYECDASLGSPPEADCTHIEWSELLPDSDTLQVSPGTPTFLHSSTPFLTFRQRSLLPLPLSVKPFTLAENNMTDPLVLKNF